MAARDRYSLRARGYKDRPRYSPLLALPAEIRLMIYSHVYGGHLRYGIENSMFEATPDNKPQDATLLGKRCPTFRCPDAKQHPLLRACKQIHSELSEWLRQNHTLCLFGGRAWAPTGYNRGHRLQSLQLPRFCRKIRAEWEFGSQDSQVSRRCHDEAWKELGALLKIDKQHSFELAISLTFEMWTSQFIDIATCFRGFLALNTTASSLKCTEYDGDEHGGDYGADGIYEDFTEHKDDEKTSTMQQMMENAKKCKYSFPPGSSLG